MASDSEEVKDEDIDVILERCCGCSFEFCKLLAGGRGDMGCCKLRLYEVGCVVAACQEEEVQEVGPH